MLRPGGRLLVLEFSKVAAPLAKAYDWYSFKVLPRLGQLVAGDADSYRYLAESIRMHPDQQALKAMMKAPDLATSTCTTWRRRGGAARRHQVLSGACVARVQLSRCIRAAPHPVRAAVQAFSRVGGVTLARFLLAVAASARHRPMPLTDESK